MKIEDKINKLIERDEKLDSSPRPKPTPNFPKIKPKRRVNLVPLSDEETQQLINILNKHCENKLHTSQAVVNIKRIFESAFRNSQ
jgi:hypothetical protein